MARLRRDIELLNAAFKAADPKLRREMLKSMRKAAEPVKTAQQGAVRGLSSSGGGGGGLARALYAAENYRGTSLSGQARAAERNRGLRDAAANATRVEARGAGRDVGVNIRTRSTHMPPDQKKLPRYMDRGQWRHPVYGGSAWVTQTTSPPGWFLQTGRKMRPEVVSELTKTVERFWAMWAARQ